MIIAEEMIIICKTSSINRAIAAPVGPILFVKKVSKAGIFEGIIFVNTKVYQSYQKKRVLSRPRGGF